jgi:hypothetical protein
VREARVRGEHNRNGNGGAGCDEHDHERFVLEPQVTGAEAPEPASERVHEQSVTMHIRELNLRCSPP